MIDYYEYETSPRKLEPEYEQDIHSRIKTKSKNRIKIQKNNSKNNKTKSKKNSKIILEIILGFSILLSISYRYSVINTSFHEKENLKKQLAELKKQNEQLQVNIEQQMNINKIEQEAKEKLGMQKLDNSQKVYVSLDKEDYVEAPIYNESNQKIETWWSKLLKDLFKIKKSK